MKKLLYAWLAFVLACSIVAAQVTPAKKAASPPGQGQKPQFKTIWEPVKRDLQGHSRIAARA